MDSRSPVGDWRTRTAKRVAADEDEAPREQTFILLNFARDIANSACCEAHRLACHLRHHPTDSSERIRGAGAAGELPGECGGVRPRGDEGARVTWPLVFEPLHDALIEDAPRRASVACGEAPKAVPWSRRVRTLRALLRRRPLR